GEHERHARGGPDPRHLRVDRAHDVRSVMGARRRLWPLIDCFGHPATRALRKMKFWIGAAAFLIVAFIVALSGANEYFFFAAYVVLTYIVLAVAWNILGGYAGYVNF